MVSAERAERLLHDLLTKRSEYLIQELNILTFAAANCAEVYISVNGACECLRAVSGGGAANRLVG